MEADIESMRAELLALIREKSYEERPVTLASGRKRCAPVPPPPGRTGESPWNGASEGEHAVRRAVAEVAVVVVAEEHLAHRRRSRSWQATAQPPMPTISPILTKTAREA